MVKLASIAVAIMAAVSGTSAFKQACTFPYDVCGFRLTDDVRGYSQDELREAAARANVIVPPNGDQSPLYNAVYNCKANGVIDYNTFCPHGCHDGDVVPNASCNA